MVLTNYCRQKKTTQNRLKIKNNTTLKTLIKMTLFKKIMYHPWAIRKLQKFHSWNALFLLTKLILNTHISTYRVNTVCILITVKNFQKTTYMSCLWMVRVIQHQNSLWLAGFFWNIIMQLHLMIYEQVLLFFGEKWMVKRKASFLF